jgi:glycosyltransferase involved in cell wall biosynthesis
LRQLIKLVPLLWFKLGLFAVWRLLPRQLRQTLVRNIVPQLLKREQRLAEAVEPAIVVGFLSATTSLGWNARQISDVTQSAGVKVYGLDVANAFAAEHLPRSDHICVPPPAVVESTATLLICVNPDQFHYAAAFLPPAVFADKYVIGWCVWELERIPDQWLKPLAVLDEIWVPSEFVRRAFVDSGVSLPFRIVPPQLDRPSSINADRARFGIAAGSFAVLLAFSLRSGVVRKNPFAAVRAFQKAFPREDDVRLVLKISDVDIEGAAWASFRREMGNDPRFVFVTDFLTDQEMWSLFASIDIALSTHRAEGYGMIPALAMLSGRAAVATGWSAVLDFMTPDNSILLPYRLAPVDDVDKRYVIEGAHWAEVDENAASAALRRLYEDTAFRDHLALAGKRSVEAHLARHRQDLVDYVQSWRRS